MSPFQNSGKWLCFFLGDIRVVVAWLFVICCAWWMVLIKSLLYSSSFSLRVATLMDRFSQIGAQARNISRPGHKSLFRYTTWFTISRVEQSRGGTTTITKQTKTTLYTMTDHHEAQKSLTRQMAGLSYSFALWCDAAAGVAISYFCPVKMAWGKTESGRSWRSFRLLPREERTKRSPTSSVVKLC